MAHEHSHGEGTTSFFVEQLVSVATCGLVAATAILLYKGGDLSKILVLDFGPWVLGGGILLVLLVFFRMVGILLTANAASTPGDVHDHHNHSHGADGVCETEKAPTHAHSHEHSHDHAHSHGTTELPMVEAPDAHEGHDHAAGSWRYVILLIPFLLFCLDLPKKGFSAEWVDRNLQKQELENISRPQGSGGDAIQLRFNELARAAIFPDSRKRFDGKRGVLRGQYRRINDKEFTLYKIDMTCCQADAVPIKARIMCEETIQQPWKDGEWVEVEGVIQFVEVKGKKNEWVPVLFLDKESQIRHTAPEIQ